MIEIFCDGAYSPSTRRGGIGVVAYKDGKICLALRRGFDYPGVTISRLELSAAIVALRCVKDKQTKVTVYSDSMYVVMCANNPAMTRKENRDLWKLLDKEMSKIHNLTLSHVRGHQTDGSYQAQGNNLADKLAVIARTE